MTVSSPTLTLISHFFFPQERKQERGLRKETKMNTNVISNWKKLELTFGLMKNTKKLIHLQLNGEIGIDENVRAAIEFLKSRKVLDKWN